MKRITVITGHYGCGKTNLSVNLAVKAAEKWEKVTVVDLDLVNPYFRTADFKKLFEEKGINLIAPDFANTNLDVPSVQFDIELLAAGDGCLIIDVGGDDAGAIALGQYATILKNFGYDMLYVVNSFRYLTGTPEETLELLRDIELVSSLKATAVVNNSNLGGDTTPQDVLGSLGYAEECARLAEVPLLFTAAKRELDIEGTKPVDMYVRPYWLE